ncbi:MAG TPA: ABC transporter substrate binding protein, partial [Opitutus sp.]|nr:ABC transporter substrate binding protein [Opitutus sp.]
DHHDAGRETGLIAARVLRGENPADIPYRSSTLTRLIVNLRLAREAGLTLPPAVLARADQIVEN